MDEGLVMFCIDETTGSVNATTVDDDDSGCCKWMLLLSLAVMVVGGAGICSPLPMLPQHVLSSLLPILRGEM